MLGYLFEHLYFRKCGFILGKAIASTHLVSHALLLTTTHALTRQLCVGDGWNVGCALISSKLLLQ